MFFLPDQNRAVRVVHRCHIVLNSIKDHFSTTRKKPLRYATRIMYVQYAKDSMPDPSTVVGGNHF